MLEDKNLDSKSDDASEEQNIEKFMVDEDEKSFIDNREAYRKQKESIKRGLKGPFYGESYSGSSSENMKGSKINHIRNFKQKHGCLWSIIIVVVILFLIGLLGKVFFGGHNEANVVDVSQTKQVANVSGNYVAMLTVNGVISSQQSVSIDSIGYDHKFFMETLKSLSKDSSCKGLILVVNSPGGGVYESDEMYQELKNFKLLDDRPIYVVMKQVAASGGYYISMASDKIFANRLTTTGSIGVTMGNVFDFSKFLEKNGIKAVSITSGPNKAMGDVFHPMTKEQKKIFMSLINETYNDFVNIVAKGRNMKVSTVKKIADGRIYTGKQALKLKLIDAFGDEDTAFDEMKADFGLKNIKLVSFAPKEAKLFDKLGIGLTDLVKGLNMSAKDKLINSVQELNEKGYKLQYLAPIRK